MGSAPTIDILIVGGGPTGISIGAEARRAGLEPLIVDKGPLLASLLEFPRDMVFFTTRDRLEIAGIPFAIPDPKPNRRQAAAYYHSVARAYDLPLALHQRVDRIARDGEGFIVTTSGRDGSHEYRSRAVALATGYFDFPRRLGVPGEEGERVHHRFEEPLRHFGEQVVVVGGGNSAVEAAMELWRSGAQVTLVHRQSEVKPSVKYWLKPDFENRVAEGSLEALYDTRVTAFREGAVELKTPQGRATLAAAASYVLIGYEPDVDLQRSSGIHVDEQSLVPDFDPATAESNIPGLYVVGTLQAGKDTNRIFIENSRDHSRRVIDHLVQRLAAETRQAH